MKGRHTYQGGLREHILCTVKLRLGFLLVLLGLLFSAADLLAAENVDVGRLPRFHELRAGWRFHPLSGRELDLHVSFVLLLLFGFSRSLFQSLLSLLLNVALELRLADMQHANLLAFHILFFALRLLFLHLLAVCARGILVLGLGLGVCQP